jgi:spermidine/putrescine-binding protein
MQIGAVRAAGIAGEDSLPPWNIAAVDGATTVSWGETGSLEELDCSIVDTRGWPDHLKNEWFGGGSIAWGWVYAYSLDTYPEGSYQPQDMGDVFDVDKVPGRRGFWRPEGWKSFLRWANLAADPSLLDTEEGKLSLLQISPEQFDTGYEMAEVLRDDITIWSSGYSDCPVALQSGDLDMCVFDTGMAFDAWKDELPMEPCWTCGIISQTDQMSVINGTSLDPELFELVQLVMGWMSLPDVHPLSSQYIGYGPVNQLSQQYMDDPIYDDAKPFLPTSPQNYQYALFTDEIDDGNIAIDQNERWENWHAGAYLGIED